jgi:hypothetical protein
MYISLINPLSGGIGIRKNPASLYKVYHAAGIIKTTNC